MKISGSGGMRLRTAEGNSDEEHRLNVWGSAKPGYKGAGYHSKLSAYQRQRPALLNGFTSSVTCRCPAAPSAASRPMKISRAGGD